MPLIYGQVKAEREAALIIIMKTSDFMEAPLTGEIQWAVREGAHQSRPVGGAV